MPKKKILLIEDDAFLGDVLSQKLKLEGYDVQLERDGAQGLKEIINKKPDLILLDLLLPTMNGYEILAAKQADDSIKNIPVIIISNSGQPVELNRVLSLGVKDYLIKADLDPENVLEKVRSAFSTSEETSGRLTGRSILCIEDDTFLSTLLKTKFAKEGCEWLHAETGEAALQILKRQTPHLVLLDLTLPGMNGFDVLTEIKKDEHMKTVPVVVLSNTAQQNDMQRTSSLGALKHLVKANHDPEDIVREVVSVLGNQE
ncbi:MAG TPA: response regulator [Candidatus Paceibacterota bacterium]|nr:response regulator [Candidatus Paceibacterota bacterium]